MPYNGNKNLLSINDKVEFTQEQITEYAKCMQDPLYFIKTYYSIVHIDYGLIPFKPYAYQEEIVTTSIDNRFVICKLPRQSGKTTVVAAIMLWYVLFHENYQILILAHKQDQSHEIMDRIKLAYEHVPRFLQQPIIEWNKGSIELGNGSKIKASATSGSAGRGGSYNCISGDGVVTLKIASSMFDLTLRDLYKTANSSKYTNNPRKGVYVFREQIPAVVHEAGRIQKIKSTRKIFSRRKAPCYTEMYERIRRPFQYSRSYDQRTHYFTSNAAALFSSKISQEASICYIQDDKWSSGYDGKNVTGSSSTFQGRVIRSTAEVPLRQKTYREDERENKSGTPREDATARSKTKNISFKNGTVGWSSQNTRAPWQDIFQSYGCEKEPGYCAESEYEPGEDCQNGGGPSWNEKIIRGTKKDEFSQAWERALEQGHEIQILTAKGFRRFRGIKRTENQPTIKLDSNYGSVECTPDHLIWSEGSWKAARSLPHTDSIHQDVYDVVSVDEVSSFICNGVLVHNCVYLDEFAFVPPNLQEEFFASVYPVISSGKTSKVLITSTPKGMNLFYKLWVDSEEGRNDYKRIDIHWSDTPGRDENWKKETIRNTSEEQFRQEFECLDGDTLVEVRDTVTGEIVTLTIRELYECV